MNITSKIIKKLPKLSLTLLILFVVINSSCILYSQEFSKELIRSKSPADWTFMIYMSADNNLEEFALKDFIEMATVGSNEEMHIVVQMDRWNGVGEDDDNTTYGNWVDTKRFYVTRNLTPTPENAIKNLGELNMGNPQTLIDFANWVIQNYPATYYFLVLWGHGSGWKSGVCFDDSGDWLTMTELKNALAQIKILNGNNNLDIVGFDACEMGMAEVYYQMRGYVDYAIGSEKDEPDRGWPYDLILSDLIANPSMTPIQIGTKVVSNYVSWSRNYSQYAVSLALIDLQQLGSALKNAITAFSENLITGLPFYKADILFARTRTEHYEDPEYHDLYHFAENMMNNIDAKRIQNCAMELIDAISSTVLVEKHSTPQNLLNGIRADHTHGLSIWLPQTGPYSNYQFLDFSTDSLWDDFLVKLASNENPESVMLEIHCENFDTNYDGLYDLFEIYYLTNVSGLNVTVEVYTANGTLVETVYNTTVENIESNFTFNNLELSANVEAYTFAVYLFNETGILQNYSEITIYSESVYDDNKGSILLYQIVFATYVSSLVASAILIIFYFFRGKRRVIEF